MPRSAKRAAALDEKKAALYIRVSTKYQIDGDSLPLQRDELPKYAQYALGIRDYEIFEDAGYSAKNTERPAYQEMMGRVRAGEFTHIVVWKLDRISRNLLDFAAMYAELKKIGTVFISKNEQFDTSTAIGEAMLKIILIFAELERNMTSERVSSVMVNRAQNGQWNGGRVPYGYKRDKETGEFSFADDEAKVVLLMFERYEKYHSLLRVATTLNEDGYKSRRGYAWTPATVGLILKSPFYSGSYRYNVYNETQKTFSKKNESEWVVVENHHPALVYPARQRAIVNILGNNDRVMNLHKNKSYERKNVHIFGGLLTCGVCGSQFQSTIDRPRAQSGWRPSIYLCSRHRRYKDCENKYISDVVLGPFVLNFLSNYIRAQRSFGRTTDTATLEKKLLRGVYFKGVRIAQESLEELHHLFRIMRFGDDDFTPVLAAGGGDELKEREILEKEKGRLERALSRLKGLFLYGEEGITEKDFIAERDNLQSSLNQINERLETLQEETAADEAPGVSDEAYMEQASYLVISEELLSKRFVDYEKLIRIVDKRMLKTFINSVVQNFCILDGKITSILFKNGVEVQFVYE